MDWKNKVVDALIEGDCFFSTFQKMRFIQLFNELKDEPFFSKGFCKCVFLASCDQEHTDFLKKVVDKLISMDAKNTDYMLKLSDEHASSLKANEKVLFRLSDDFLSGQHSGRILFTGAVPQLGTHRRQCASGQSHHRQSINCVSHKNPAGIRVTIPTGLFHCIPVF